MDAKIKIIDVYGSFDNKGEMHHYTYCTSDYSLDSGWTQHVSDLRTELAPRAGFYYCSWCTKEGWWISKVIPNPHDSRKDPVMLSICIGKCRPKYGNKAVALLDSFVDFFVIQKNWDDIETERKLMCDDQDLELLPCNSNESALPVLPSNAAYRTYETKEELFDFLSFLPQPDCEKYSRIFFVPKEKSDGMPIECLDEKVPFKRFYSIQYPENCSSPSGKTEIMEGEELKLVYTKHGLEPLEKFIKGGENSDFAFVEGDTMHIRSGKDLGLVHNRVIEIICKDKSDKRIYDFSLRNYTQQNNAIVIKGKTVVVPENEKGDIIVWVDPSDEKYDSQKVNLTGVAEDHKDVCLETKYYNVVFKMKGKTFKTTEDTLMSPSEAKNDWDEYDCEIDNLNRIVCFTVHRFSPERKHHQKTHFVREELPLGKRIGNFFKEWWTLILVVLVGIAAVYFMYAAIATYLVKYPQWPFGTKPEKEQETLGHNHGAFGDDKKEDEKTIDSTEFFVQHDIDYLENNIVWKKEELQTNEFKTLYDAIASGKINEVIQKYSSLFGEMNKGNDKFNKIVEAVKILQDDPGKKRKVADVMKKNGQGGCINLNSMWDDILNVSKEEVGSKVQEPSKAKTPGSNQQSNNNTKTRADINSNNP